ncbi:MAG: winged helix-turn-helix domain-containing protein [Acetobacteraceae bacterium]|nr:winged helix-turn-helix domain-containing protein [Acetobacteraceae bacterium]
MAAPRRLLLLTLDAALAGLLPQQLALGTGYTAEAAAPEAGAALLATGRFDAVLLDSAAWPPATDPAEAFAHGPVVRPLLLLGGRPGPGLDHVPKPVRMADLVARLNQLLARFDASPEAAIRLGAHLFHAAGRWLETGGRRVKLTEKEAAILLHLHRAAPRAVSRAELLDEVWGYSAAVATHTLETHIYRLRRKLAAAADLLVTEEGGYRLGG